jgi:hypothetical protein
MPSSVKLITIVADQATKKASQSYLMVDILSHERRLWKNCTQPIFQIQK